NQLAPLGEDTDLTFPLGDVNANMVHGWPLLSAALTAGSLLWGSICHHVEREASRFITSIPQPIWPHFGSFCLSDCVSKSGHVPCVRFCCCLPWVGTLVRLRHVACAACTRAARPGSPPDPSGRLVFTMRGTPMMCSFGLRHWRVELRSTSSVAL